MKKKKRINIFIAVLSIISLISCGQDRAGTGKLEYSSQVNEKELLEANLNEEEFAVLVGGYLKVKNALADTDAEAASFEAEELIHQMKESQNNILKKVLKSAKDIADKKEIDDQRASFEVLSNDAYQLIKNSKFDHQELYYQYCPMAFEHTGAHWLSAESKVLNPYFGDEMLRCGKVTEVIE